MAICFSGYPLPPNPLGLRYIEPRHANRAAINDAEPNRPLPCHVSYTLFRLMLVRKRPKPPTV